MSQVATTSFSTVLTELYNSGFDYLLANAQTDRAKRWVNQSYQELCAIEQWPFLKTSTTGTSPVSIPTLNRVLSVRDTNLNNRLVESDIDTLQDINPNLTTTGTAAWYYLDYSSGPVVSTFPVTTNTIEVVFYQNPTPLAADGDILVIPDQFIDIVVLGAMRRAYIDGTDTANQYQLAKQEWSDRIQFMRSQLMPRFSYQAIEYFPLSSTDY